MKLLSLALRVCAIATCLTACAPKQTSESITNDSTAGFPQIDMYDFAAMPEDFAGFLGTFPQKALPARFPSDETYNEGELIQIDETMVRQFLNADMFDYEPDYLYYCAAFKAHPDLFSTVVFQVSDMGRPGYMLVNYNLNGELLSSRTLAYSESGGGIHSWSSAVVDSDGSIVVSDYEEGRTADYTEENVFAYQITPAGAILPTGIPPGLLTTFHSAVLKKGKYLVAPRYGYSVVQLSSTAFNLRQEADSILCIPNDYFSNVGHRQLYDLIVDSFTKTPEGYRLALKDTENHHSLYDALSHITLNPVKSSPGVYQFVFSPAGKDYVHVGQAAPEFVITQESLSSYETRKLPS
jgi:hypothetical protein